MIIALFPSSLVLGADVVAVRSQSSAKAAKLYDKAIAGIRQTIPSSFQVIFMKGELRDAERLAEEVLAAKPKVVVTVGLRASAALKDRLEDIPLVFCMVSDSIQKKWKASNATGITMQPAPAAQLMAFKRVVPSLHRIGLVYYPKLSGTFVQAARRSAKALGMEIIAAEIKDRREVPDALKSVLRKSDGFWIIRDGKVVNPEFFSQMLMIQAERKLPVMAFSERFVKKGALCSFSAGYGDQGKQAAKMVMAILSGKKPAELPIQAPDGILTINLKAASKIGVYIPTELSEQTNVKTIQ